MKNTLQRIAYSLILCVFCLLSGCAALSNMREMTPEQRQAFLEKKAHDWLADPTNRKTVEDALVLAGAEVMQLCEQEYERKQIADLMWASSVAAHSLSSGEAITPEKLAETLSAFGVDDTSSVYVVQYTAAVNLAWQQIYRNLSIVKDPSLAKDWLLVLARAGQRVGNLYRS